MRRITCKHVSWLHRINNIAREYEIDGSEEKFIRLCHRLKTMAIKEKNNSAHCCVPSDAVVLSLGTVDILGQIIMCCRVCPVYYRTMSSNSDFHPRMPQYPLPTCDIAKCPGGGRLDPDWEPLCQTAWRTPKATFQLYAQDKTERVGRLIENIGCWICYWYEVLFGKQTMKV